MSADGLVARLESPVPGSLPAGRGTAVLLQGTCFHASQEIRSLEVSVGSHHQPASASGMPRMDLLESLYPGAEPAYGAHPRGPEARTYRSGFWAVAPVAAVDTPAALPIKLTARLADGGEAGAEVGSIRAGEAPPPEGEPAGRRIAICATTYEPDPELLARQLDSIRAQTEEDWLCVISDDCSRPESVGRIEDLIADDPRFRLHTSTRRRGVYRNFERCLELVPRDAELVALSDQDDVWHPDKLGVLAEAIQGSNLAHSDQRVVDRGGRVLSDTYWTEREPNSDDVASLLVTNSVTGAAAMMTREITGLALPFPVVPGEQYHDHWLALLALATGHLAYVDRPLADYVQHRGARLGHARANRASESRGRSPRRTAAGWRENYFSGHLRLQVLAAAALARGGDRVPGDKRAALEDFLGSERSPASFARLVARGLRRPKGSLGAERSLAGAVAWRRLAGARRRIPLRGPFLRDAAPPAAPTPEDGHAAVDHLRSKIEPLAIDVRDGEPERVNLLVPTFDLRHLFGGYIAKFNLARRLAATGLRVRIVAVDPTPALPGDWRERVESYSGLDGLFGDVETCFARDEVLVISPGDRFIATTFWTAHIAAAALPQTRRSRFLYLIQEYEPFTFAMGSWAAVAQSSYDLPHVALFSTGLLRDFFAERKIGVFAAGGPGEEAAGVLENAITAVATPTASELGARASRRLLFYARPEAHAARNMFELGAIALGKAAEEGVFDSEDWELRGIGTVGAGRTLNLGGGVELDLAGRSSQAAYAEMLPQHDVGLALMLTPHPSLVPLEMAAAGMLTVTNTFETKTAAALRSISANLIPAEPSVDGIVAGLRSAVAGAGDAGRRAEGAAFAWPRDWDESLRPAVMERVLALVEAS